MILNEMQMLDQKIASARPVNEQRAHFVECFRIDLSALRGARRAAPRRSAGLLGRRSNGGCSVTLIIRLSDPKIDIALRRGNFQILRKAKPANDLN